MNLLEFHILLTLTYISKMALILKTRRTDMYDGRRDKMTVNEWIYSVESYLSLIEVGAQNGIAKSDNIRYDATFFS